MFQVATPNRTFYVQVESKQEYDDWLKGFNDLLSVVKPAPQHVSSHYTVSVVCVCVCVCECVSVECVGVRM